VAWQMLTDTDRETRYAELRDAMTTQRTGDETETGLEDTPTSAMALPHTQTSMCM